MARRHSLRRLSHLHPCPPKHRSHGLLRHWSSCFRPRSHCSVFAGSTLPSISVSVFHIHECVPESFLRPLEKDFVVTRTVRCHGCTCLLEQAVAVQGGDSGIFLRRIPPACLAIRELFHPLGCRSHPVRYEHPTLRCCTRVALPRLPILAVPKPLVQCVPGIDLQKPSVSGVDWLDFICAACR